ncbi:hypothetical protein ACN47E_001890 [Coniothyrium glycines]
MRVLIVTVKLVTSLVSTRQPRPENFYTTPSHRCSTPPTTSTSIVIHCPPHQLHETVFPPYKTPTTHRAIAQQSRRFPISSAPSTTHSPADALLPLGQRRI